MKAIMELSKIANRNIAHKLAKAKNLAFIKWENTYTKRRNDLQNVGYFYFYIFHYLFVLVILYNPTPPKFSITLVKNIL